MKDNDIQSIVMSYLLHNCFDETADSLASTTGINQPVIDRDNLERRKREYKQTSRCLMNDMWLLHVLIDCCMFRNNALYTGEEGLESC